MDFPLKADNISVSFRLVKKEKNGFRLHSHISIVCGEEEHQLFNDQFSVSDEAISAILGKFIDRPKLIRALLASIVL